MKTTTISLKGQQTTPLIAQLVREGDRIIVTNPFDDYDIKALAATPTADLPPEDYGLAVHFLLLLKKGCMPKEDTLRLFIGRSGQLCEAQIGQVNLFLDGGTIVVYYRLQSHDGTFIYPSPDKRRRGDWPESKRHPLYQGPLETIKLGGAKTEETIT